MRTLFNRLRKSQTAKMVIFGGLAIKISIIILVVIYTFVASDVIDRFNQLTANGKTSMEKIFVEPSTEDELGEYVIMRYKGSLWNGIPQNEEVIGFISITNDPELTRYDTSLVYVPENAPDADRQTALYAGAHRHLIYLASIK